MKVRYKKRKPCIRGLSKFAAAAQVYNVAINDFRCLSGDLANGICYEASSLGKQSHGAIAACKNKKAFAMKKFLIAVVALVGWSIAGHAQTTASPKTTAPVTKVKVKTTQTHAEKAVTLPAKATAATVPAKPQTAAGAPKKADGTPDMRYKSNKEAAKATPKLKKDGTPDKRYKENKKQ